MFRFLYAGIFRYASGFTHSLPVAVNRLVEDAGANKVVVLEGTSGSQRGLTFAPIAFGLMLYVRRRESGAGCVRPTSTRRLAATSNLVPMPALASR